MTTVVVSQPFLFPWRGFFEHLELADVLVVYDDVQFRRQGFVNRVQIKGPAKPTWLTIPVRRGDGRQLISQLQWADDLDWRQENLALLRRCYEDAPFGEAMVALVESVYRQPHGSLVDLLVHGLDRCREAMGLGRGPQVVRSSALGVGGRSTQRLVDICRVFDATRYVTGHGASDYLEHEQFEAEGIAVEYMDYSLAPYPQAFGEFTPYVSVLDLLANTGPQAASFLEPRTVGWREFIDRRT